MVTLEVQDKTLEKQLTELLDQQFKGNVETMLRELVEVYTTQRNRLKYSGILHWPQDPLTYQKGIRSEWG